MLHPRGFYIVSATTLFDNSLIPSPSKKMYPTEQIIETASRLCYNSLDKLGTNDKFISGLIKVGHLDVLEHAVAAFYICVDVDSEHEANMLNLKANQFIVKHRYMAELKVNITELEPSDRERNTQYRVEIIFGGNFRTWLEIIWDTTNLGNRFYDLVYADVIYCLVLLAPNIFGEYFTEDIESRMISKPQVLENMCSVYTEYKSAINYITPISLNQDRADDDPTPAVIPLGCARHVNQIPNLSDMSSYNHMNFFVPKASRAFSHQHVRHRMLSFSQLSQRYVDFVSKQYGGFVYPAGLTLNQLSAIREVFDYIKNSYQQLRADGVKKEDARAILPNAAETSLVFSGYAKGIEHYIKLRTATDAQAEIRNIAEVVKYHYEGYYNPYA